jgi:hypothetical protein
MAFLAKLRLGNGTLKPKLRAALESEGLVLIEEAATIVDELRARLGR